ncbi:MAG: hypothetical protein ACYCR5_08780 [Leptospirillum sp.]
MRRRQEGAPERSGLNRQKEGFGGEAVALSFRKGEGGAGNGYRGARSILRWEGFDIKPRETGVGRSSAVV